MRRRKTAISIATQENSKLYWRELYWTYVQICSVPHASVCESRLRNLERPVPLRRTNRLGAWEKENLPDRLAVLPEYPTIVSILTGIKAEDRETTRVDGPFSCASPYPAEYRSPSPARRSTCSAWQRCETLPARRSNVEHRLLPLKGQHRARAIVPLQRQIDLVPPSDPTLYRGRSMPLWSCKASISVFPERYEVSGIGSHSSLCGLERPRGLVQYRSLVGRRACSLLPSSASLRQGSGESQLGGGGGSTGMAHGERRV